MNFSSHFIHSNHSAPCTAAAGRPCLLPLEGNGSTYTGKQAVICLGCQRILSRCRGLAHISGIMSSRLSTQHRVMPRTRNRGPCKPCQAAKRKVRGMEQFTQGACCPTLTNSKPSVIRRNPTARAAANRIYYASPLLRPGGGSGQSTIPLITRQLQNRRLLRGSARQQRRHLRSPLRP